MYDIGISEIAVTAKYEDTEDTEDRRHFEKTIAIFRYLTYKYIESDNEAP